MSVLLLMGRSFTHIQLSWNSIPTSLGNFSIHRKRKLHLLHRLLNMIMHQWLMPTAFQVSSPWLLQRFAALITVIEMRFLLEHSLPFNLECYFYETSKRKTLYKSYFRFEVETHTRSTINTAVFTNNPKGPFNFRRKSCWKSQSTSKADRAFSQAPVLDVYSSICDQRCDWAPDHHRSCRLLLLWLSQDASIAKSANFLFATALPNLSGTISTALLDSPMFKRDEESDESEPSEFVRRAGDVIFAAKKLRHPVLFRECFIHLVARLHDDDFLSIWLPALRQDKDIWSLLNAGKSNLRQTILRAQHAILLAAIAGRLEKCLEELIMSDFYGDPEDSASFYKSFFNRRKQYRRDYYEGVDETFASVAKLLQSNLVLDRTGFGAGEGPYHDTYLCAELEDEDMPWDAAEFDW